MTEFICTRTVDALKKKELRECAARCAEARVIVLEDFYRAAAPSPYPQRDKNRPALACLRGF